MRSQGIVGIRLPTLDQPAHGLPARLRPYCIEHVGPAVARGMRDTPADPGQRRRLETIVDAGIVGWGELALQQKANRVIDALVEVGVFPGTKAMLALLGQDVGGCRAPFAPLTDAGRDKLCACLGELGDQRAIAA